MVLNLEFKHTLTFNLFSDMPGMDVSKGSTCKFAGMIPASIVAIILTKEFIPLAISECPIFDFTAPIKRGSFRFSQNIRAIALHSAISPNGVPVNN